VKTPLWLLAVVLLGCAVAGSAFAEAHPRAELLIEPAELAKPGVADQFIILDVRTEDAYAQGHIAGARRVDLEAWAKEFQDGQDAAAWSKRIGELGIGPASKVVVYDDAAHKNAGRIWWILRYWGVGDVRLLNGGWKAWTTEGLPTTTDAPTVAPAEFSAQGRAAALADKQHVLDLLQSSDYQIIDTRSENEYCGIDAQKNKRAGAMPGAKHLEWSQLIDQQTHRFKPPEELRSLFEKAGIDLMRPTVSHCQSGGRASVMVFGLELMGADDARNYYRSWAEWGNTDDTPIEKPASSAGQ